MSESHRAGYLYIASNPSMPGIVKAVRTQSCVEERLKGLYTTGVPTPFVAECTRFFIDCFEAEARLFFKLGEDGKRCGEREFFQIDKSLAAAFLNDLYRRQYQSFDECEFGYDSFEACAAETFRIVHKQGRMVIAEEIALLLTTLPSARREQAKLALLAEVMRAKDEYFCTWLVRQCGADPDSPIKTSNTLASLLRYYPTAHENAIFLELASFERYLERIGCDIAQSSCLCYIVDALINAPTGRGEEALIKFAATLLSRGVNPDSSLNVDVFAEAPRVAYPGENFRFDVFPRNSNLTCRQVVALVAKDRPLVAKLLEIMSSY